MFGCCIDFVVVYPDRIERFCQQFTGQVATNDVVVGLTGTCILVSFHVQRDVSICDVGTFCAVGTNKTLVHVERCDGTGGRLSFGNGSVLGAVAFLPTDLGLASPICSPYWAR